MRTFPIGSECRDVGGKCRSKSRPCTSEAEKNSTNLSARDFIKNIRLQQAAALLKEKKLTVSEVAYAGVYESVTFLQFFQGGAWDVA